MKKLSGVFLAVLIVLFSFGNLSACMGQEAQAQLPDYIVSRDESKVFKIGSWVGVPNYLVDLDSNDEVILGSAREMTDEEFIGQYRTFKESGIGIMYPGEWKCSASDGGPYSGKYTTDSRFISRMLSAAEETGIKQLIRDYTLNGILKNAKLTDEEAVAAAKAAVSYYIDEPALFGHLIEDEPVLNEMEESRLALKRYKMAFPELQGLVNLCPIIGQAKDFTDEFWDETECTAYEYYIDSFIEQNDFTDYVSYDHYPLLGNNETKRTSLEPTFLYAMDIVGRKAKESGKEMWTYLQSIGYGAVNRIPTSVGDISVQAYSFMAYGGKMISWFCYWSPVRFDGLTYFTEAMIELDGTKTAVYDYVKTVNSEILSFDDIYLNFDWQGVMTQLGRENKMGENDNFAYIENTVMKSHERISKIVCEQDTLIGVFKDGEERDGFMVVNFSDSGKELKDAGFNSYFMQFRNSYEFFERWYLHKNNPLLPAEKFDIETIQKRVKEAIKTRGLIYHAVGHGWTAEALGCSVNGWEKRENPDRNSLLALVDGKRGYFKGIPSNTNLCYSQPKTIELFSDCVAEYAVAHPEIDVLHVWLADDCKNFCECEQCRNTLPSDFYIEILNEIDRKLTERKIGVKVAFLVYCELLWPPEKNRIKNEDRFILMFAPITRSYSEKFSEAIERSGHYGIEPYFLNESDFPRELSRNLAFLRAWKERFRGDSFIFDYPLMWEVNKDISTISLSESIRDDILSFEKVGLNGEISCQLQRVFFPHGLNQSLMGRLLLGEPVKENYTREFLRESFGKKRGAQAFEVMKLIRQNIPQEYFRYEIPAICFSLAEKIEKVRYSVLKLKEELFGDNRPFADENERLLGIWTQLIALLLEAFEKKMLGENCNAEMEKSIHFLRENELAVQPYLDVCYVIMTLTDILSFRWDKEMDEGTDDLQKGSVIKQVGESFVCDSNPVKLRYNHILPESIMVYKKSAYGSVAQVYEEGRDFFLDCAKGSLIRTKNSALPNFSQNAFYGLPYFNHNDFEKWGNGEFMLYTDYKYDSKQISDAELAKEISIKNGSFGSLQEKICFLREGNIKITVFGDSISYGCEATAEGNAYFYKFANAIERKYGCKVDICNRSVIGNTTDDALARLDSDFHGDDSQLVLTAFGMNDQNKFGSRLPIPPERFEKNLRRIADELLQRNKFPVFITPCVPNEKWVYCSGRIGEYADIISKVAEEYHLPCADVYSLWTKQLEAGKRKNDLLNNAINHPTDYGHFLYYLQLKQLI